MAQVVGADWPEFERSVQETFAWAAASEGNGAVGTRGLLIGLMRAGGPRSEPNELLGHFGVPAATFFDALQNVRREVKIDPDVSRPSDLKAVPSFTSNAEQAIGHARELRGRGSFRSTRDLRRHP